MTNNNCLRSLRYTFALNNTKVIEIFSLAKISVSDEEVVGWLKRDEDSGALELSDSQLAGFLNGFIIKNRGEKDETVPEPEKVLSNNLVLKKLKIALNLQSDEMKEILDSVDFSMSKHELSAFFRKPNNKNYRECLDQVLRMFLKGLQLKYRPEKEVKKIRGTE